MTVAPTARGRVLPLSLATTATICAGPEPDLTAYDLLAVGLSGKDAQVALDLTTRAAAAAGVPDRVRTFHADLGLMEWPGVTFDGRYWPSTAEHAAALAAAYGITGDRHSTVARLIDDDRAGGDRRPDSLLEYAARRGMFPSNGAKWCTSDFKSKQIAAAWTPFVRHHRRQLDRPVRILNILGLRAEESPTRRRRPAYRNVVANSARHVDEWLPAHAWPLHDVRALVDAGALPHHWAYDSVPGAGDWGGQSRLSCSLCILSNQRDLILAARRRPRLAALYARVEDVTGYRFRDTLPMAEIIALAAAAGGPDPGIVLSEDSAEFATLASRIEVALAGGR